MGAMLAKLAQRDSKHVRRQIMPTASVGMAPVLPKLRNIHAAVSDAFQGQSATLPGANCTRHFTSRLAGLVIVARSVGPSCRSDAFTPAA